MKLPFCMEMASRVMSLVLVIWMGCLCSSQAYTFYVGGNEGWITHPSNISYHRWAEMNRFQINDSLVFRYKKGSDSVLVVTKDDYERCNKDSPRQVFKDGDSKFKFDKSGPFFFISGRTQHCEKGQKLVTVVLSDRHHNAPPSPSPTHSPPMKPPPSHSPPPPSHNAPPPHLPSAPSQTPTHSPPQKPPPSHTPPPSSHIAPAPTPQPTQAPPPHSTISAPPSKAPQTSPTRSPIPTPSLSPKNPPHSPSHSPSPSPHHQAPTPSPDAHSPPPSTPKTPPSPSPAVHLAPSTSPKAESPKNGEGAPQPDVENHHHPAPSPHASSPAYPHHAPAPAPSAAPGLSASFSLLVGIFLFAISLVSAGFV
ncbi:uncharacterized protein LOC142538022 [Primulina tabacum]|uniref:uncharacterized protein LOC142538022 n=1 Tax=Primulina tabacum TaxID=48773 RepID=UPI003F591F30